MGKGQWALVGLLGAGTLALLALVLLDSRPTVAPTPSAPSARPVTTARPAPAPFLEDTPARIPAPAPPADNGDKTPPPKENLTGLEGYPPSGRYGEQADEDRKRLGDAAYTDMERMWARGKSNRGSPGAQDALQDLIDRFPDTHRAGCANIELALHRLKDTRFSQRQRIEGAESLLKRARDRYADSRCDGDVKAEHMASMTLAVEVYRYSDARLSRSLLEQVAQLPDSELDSRGQPLAKRAAKLLNVSPASAHTPDDTRPPPPQAHVEKPPEPKVEEPGEREEKKGE
jgi:hypothetical protein